MTGSFLGPLFFRSTLPQQLLYQFPEPLPVLLLQSTRNQSSHIFLLEGTALLIRYAIENGIVS